MVLDIVLIVLLIFMMIYGYIKGCISIVAKLVSLIIAFVLAYLLAGTVGDYLANTNFGQDIQTSIENNILSELAQVEESTVISMIQDKLNLENDQEIAEKIIDYVFVGIGFIGVFVVARIVLWIAQKIIENIFELPVLRAFNKLGGIITAALLFIIEVSIILAIIKSISTLAFMNGTVSVIQSSVITKVLYDHNIFTNLILSKII